MINKISINTIKYQNLYLNNNYSQPCTLYMSNRLFFQQYSIYVMSQIHYILVKQMSLYIILTFIFDMSYFGIANNCNSSSMQLSINQYEKDPHNGPHETLNLKQVAKKINDMKIGNFGVLLKQYENQLHEKIDQFLIQMKSSMTKKLFNEMCTKVFVNKTQFSDEFINNLRKMADFDFENLKCHDVSEIMKSFNSSVKNKDIQRRAQSFIDNFIAKTKLMNQILDEKDDFEPEKSSIIGNVSVDFSKNSSGKNVSKIEEFDISDEPKKVLQKGNAAKDSQIKVQMTDYSNYYAKEHPIDDEEVRSPQKKQKSTQQQNSLSSLDISEILKQQKEQEEEGIKEQLDQLKEKKQKVQEVVGSENKYDHNDPAKSYLVPQEAKIYTKVIRLKDPKYLNSEQTFNIKLKVIQQLIFRLQKITHNDGSGKIYKKVKFVAGDETGNVVCFSNVIPQVSKGKYVVLQDCRLIKYNNSYEISSTKCKQLSLGKNFEGFEINLENPCISQLVCMNPIIYMTQHHDQSWPSIRGLTYLNPQKCKKIQLVATISWILQKGEKYYDCHIHDGTGRVRALIDKQQCPILEQGKTYLFRRMVILKSNNKQILTVKSADIKKPDKKKFSPLVIKEFVYDNHLIDLVDVIISQKAK